MVQQLKNVVQITQRLEFCFMFELNEIFFSTLMKKFTIQNINIYLHNTARIKVRNCFSSMFCSNNTTKYNFQLQYRTVSHIFLQFGPLKFDCWVEQCTFTPCLVKKNHCKVFPFIYLRLNMRMKMKPKKLTWNKKK